MKLEKGTFGIFPAKLADGLPTNEQVVLVWLWKYSNENGTCFPSLMTLGRNCDMSKTTVVKALAGLEARGMVSKSSTYREDGGQSHNVYTVHITPIEVFNPGTQAGQPPCSPDGLTPVSGLATNYTSITKPICQQGNPTDPIGYKQCKAIIAMWAEYLKGRPHFGRVIRVVRPIIRELGQDEAARRLAEYIKNTDRKFASLERFAETHGQYAMKPKPVFRNPHEKLEGEA